MYRNYLLCVLKDIVSCLDFHAEEKGRRKFARERNFNIQEETLTISCDVLRTSKFIWNAFGNLT